MPFEDVHDLELIADVTEENHITLESDAPDVGAQFRLHPSLDSGQGGKLVAAVAELPNESLGDGEAPAGLGDIAQNIDEVGLNRSKKDRRLTHRRLCAGVRRCTGRERHRVDRP